MKNKKDLYLIFRDKQSNVVFEGVWHKIPFRETYIIEKCVELYGDPEPCFIHRSAALSRILTEMITLFEKYEHDEMPIVDLNDETARTIKSCIDQTNISACQYIEVKYIKGK